MTLDGFPPVGAVGEVGCRDCIVHVRHERGDRTSTTHYFHECTRGELCFREWAAKPAAPDPTASDNHPPPQNVRPFGWRERKSAPETNKAAGTSPDEPPAASDSTPNDAVKRGEVGHENMTL